MCSQLPDVGEKRQQEEKTGQNISPAHDPRNLQTQKLLLEKNPGVDTELGLHYSRTFVIRAQTVMTEAGKMIN